jgi:hypothetical protein
MVHFLAQVTLRAQPCGEPSQLFFGEKRVPIWRDCALSCSTIVPRPVRPSANLCHLEQSRGYSFDAWSPAAANIGDTAYCELGEDKPSINGVRSSADAQPWAMTSIALQSDPGDG